MGNGILRSQDLHSCRKKVKVMSSHRWSSPFHEENGRVGLCCFTRLSMESKEEMGIELEPAHFDWSVFKSTKRRGHSASVAFSVALPQDARPRAEDV